MESLVQIGLSNAVVAVVLAGVAALVGALVRKPALTHGLWLLVLLKLVTPPLFLIPIPWSEPAGQDKVAALVAALPEEGPAEAAAVPPFLLWAEGEVFEVRGEEVVVPDVPAHRQAVDAALQEIEEAPAVAAGWWRLLGGVWLAGAVAWFAVAFSRIAAFHRLLRHATPAPAALCEQIAALAERLGLKRLPSVWLVPGKLAPMIWTAPTGPRLLLPAELWDELPAGQRRTLLVHELAHLVRRDHWVRVLEMFTLGLYWWHPIVWIACRQLREAEEQCCDAWVVSTLDGSRRDYAEALVETLDFLAKARTATPSLASGVGRVSDLKRRLTMILRGTTPRALTWRGVFGLLALAGFLLPALPVLAQQPGGDPAAALKELREKLAELEKKLATRPAQPPATKVEAPKIDAEALKKAEADLKEAQKILQAKSAELAELSKKVAEAQAKVAKAGGKVEAAKVIRLSLTGEPGKEGFFRVEPFIDGGKDILFLKKFEGKEAEDVIRWRFAPAVPGVPGVHVPPVPPAPPAPGTTARVVEVIGRPATPAAPGTPARVVEVVGQPRPAGGDNRLDNIERQLGELRRLIEEMRRNPGPGRTPPAAPPGTGTGGRTGQPVEFEFKIAPAPESKPGR